MAGAPNVTFLFCYTFVALHYVTLSGDRQGQSHSLSSPLGRQIGTTGGGGGGGGGDSPH